MSAEVEAEERALIGRAIAGEAGSIERLMSLLQDRIFALALRFLWSPEDAEDATQEILLRILTHLSTFRGESKLSTWAYRIALNYLLNLKRTRRREMRRFAMLAAAHRPEDFSGKEAPAASNDAALQVRAACSYSMLQVLPPEYRAAFLLGVVVGMSGEDGALVLEISPAAFRQRLSRARRRMQGFVESHCGLVRSANPCRCERRVAFCQQSGMLAPYQKLGRQLQSEGKLEEIQRRFQRQQQLSLSLRELYQQGPYDRAPQSLERGIQRLLRGARPRRDLSP
ncbi:MAG: RNA polymerase sigma factor [Leptospirales bacterium]|nr:RNA polymerase sigma factor [Leptospirales bacterium]